MDVLQAPVVETQSTLKADSQQVLYTYLLRMRVAWPTPGFAQSRAPG